MPFLGSKIGEIPSKNKELNSVPPSDGTLFSRSKMLNSQVCGKQLIQAVDHHIIKCTKKSIFFDVERLKVFAVNKIDKEILTLSRMPVSVDALLSGFKEEDNVAVERRILKLLDDGFLFNSNADIKKAPSLEPTDYVTFMVNVAQRCNLTCNYCYVNRGHFDYPSPPIAQMSSNDAENLVAQIYRLFPGLRVYGYHFYGGEPLLNFDAIRIIVKQALIMAETTGTTADFHITTNGTLVTKEIAEFMEHYRFTVYYSFDSDQRTHDEVRRYKNGRGSFNNVERNLKKLRNRPGVHLILSSVVRDDNCLSTALDKLATSGARQCKAERVRLDDDNPSALVGDSLDNYVSDIQGLVAHYIDHLERTEKPLDYRLTSKILQLLVRKRRDFFCPAGERMFGIAANGELYPCSLHVGRTKSRLGNLLHGIDQNVLQQFRHRFSAAGKTECLCCWNRTLCGGGCSAMSDRFGHEKCDVLRAESEAAIKVFYHFAEHDPMQLVSLVSPKIARWMNGEINDAVELAPTEPAAELDRKDNNHAKYRNSLDTRSFA